MRIFVFFFFLLGCVFAQSLGAVEITITGIIGHGTNLRSDGGFLAARGPSSFPINDSGTVLINRVYSSYPNPGDGFLLTNDGSTHDTVSAPGDGMFLQLDGFTLNNLNRLTYQRGPVFEGNPQYYQLFSIPPPYTNGVGASEPYASYAYNVYTNSSGQGVAKLEGGFASDGLSRIVRLNGDGTTTALAIDPSYLTSFARPTKILENGDIYVALLNYGNQSYEIWRFAAGETANHTVVYSIAGSQAAIQSWDVNQNGHLVVAEGNAQGQAWARSVLADGTAVIVQGTQIGGFGTSITNATYSGVFINMSGRIAAVRSYTDNSTGSPVGAGELLYADPGSSAEVVLRTGDILNGGVILNIASTSEMNEAGQLTIFMQLNVSPLSPPTNQLVVRVDPMPNPTIASFSPTSGPVGTSVVIAGAHFTGASGVTFNGINAAYNVDSDAQITAMVPSGATSGPIAVTAPGGTATSSASFVVTTVSGPTITSFSPSSGGVGTSVTIKGTNFAGATAVSFNGTNAAFKVKGSQITATVPSGATTGPIAVTTPNGTGITSANFTVIPAPTIAQFSPATGPGGTSVTITGANFTGATAVKFNTSNAKFTVVSPTMITATVPNGAKSGPIFITTAGGTANSATIFTVTK